MSDDPEESPEPAASPEEELPEAEVRVDRPDQTRPLIGSEQSEEAGASDP